MKTILQKSLVFLTLLLCMVKGFGQTTESRFVVEYRLQSASGINPTDIKFRTSNSVITNFSGVGSGTYVASNSMPTSFQFSYLTFYSNTLYPSNMANPYLNLTYNSNIISFLVMLYGPKIISDIQFVGASGNYGCPDDNAILITVNNTYSTGLSSNYQMQCRNNNGTWQPITSLTEHYGETETFNISYSQIKASGVDPYSDMYFRTYCKQPDGGECTSTYTYPTGRQPLYFLPKFEFPAGASLIIEPPVCAGDNAAIKIPYEGTTDFTVTVKGTNDYSYGSNPSLLGCSNETISGIKYYLLPVNLAPGNYILVIENKVGLGTPCPLNTSFTIPTVPAFSISQPTYASYSDNSQQQIQIRTRGGTAPVSFSIAGSRDQSVTIHVGSNNFTEQLASSTVVSGTTYYQGTVSIDLPKGTYTNVYANNASGCSAAFSGSFELKEPDAITFTTIPANPNCFGENGSLTLSNINGGTGAYSYFTDSGNAQPFNTSTVEITDISPGSHSITIKDEYENSLTQSFSIGVAPSAITINSETTQPTTFGGNDGTVTITASGGTSPYQYGKNNANYQISNILSGFLSGETTVYVKDAKGCEYPFVVTIPEGRQITLESATTAAPTCNGGTDGNCVLVIGNLEGTLSVTGLPQYCTYSISANKITITGLETGDYSCTVIEDYNGRTNNYPASFSIPYKSLIDITTTVTPVFGKGTSSGAIAVNVSGGNSGTYRVVLLDEQNNQLSETTTTNNCVFENLPGAYADGGKLYNLKVYDSMSCTKDATVRIPEPEFILQLTATQTAEVSCYGNSDAAIEISASGGWGNYQYGTDNNTWNNTTIFNNLPAGNYVFYVKDKSNATTSATIIITEPQALNITVQDITDAICYGSTGSIRFLVSGGTPPYVLTPALGTITTTTENGNIFMTVSALPAADYTFTLRDSHNCSLQAVKTTVGQPEKLTVATSNLTQPTCGLDNGSLTATASGGIAPYGYTLMLTATNAVVQTITSSAAVQFENIAWGNYYISVTDKNGCAEQSTPLIFNQYTNPAITGANAIDAACFDESNGKITAIAQKGTAGIDYFTLTNTADNTTIQSLTGIFESLKANDYILHVFDANGCQSQNAYPVTIKQPNLLRIEVDTIVPVINKGANDGKIQFRVAGGNTGNVAVYLKDDANIKTDSIFVVRGFTNELSVKTGAHTLEAIDCKDCSFTTETFQVDEPADTLRLIIEDVQDALCKSQTGKIRVEGEGGWGGYSYKRAIDGQYTTLNRFENLYPGTYFITVKDKRGATASKTVTVYEPQDSLKAEITRIQLPTCTGNGALSIALSGGTSPYKLFSDKGNDTIFAAAPATVQWTNVASGALLLHLTDINGCKFELETVVSDTALLRINGFKTVPPDVPSRADGSIQATISGGASPLSYAWRKIGDAVSFPNNPLINNLSSGYYELKVTEGNGCSATNSVYLPDPDDETISVVETGDETAVEAASGYAILYSGLNFTNIRVINPENNYTDYPATTNNTNFYISSDSIYLNNLEGGKWFIIGTTLTGQNAIAGFEIKPYEAFVFGKINIVPASTSDDSDGSISVELQGGGGGNTFVWTDGQGKILPSIDDEYSTQIGNLPAGKYTLTVTDRYGNAISKEMEVLAPEQALQIEVLEQKNQSCHGTVDAYVIISAIGGWGDYRYAHERQPANNNFEYSNTEVYPDLETGDHYFYVVDKYGKTAQLKITVTEPDELRASVANIENVKCKDDVNGQITFNISGGNAPYYFKEQRATIWQKGNVTPPLPAGEYTFEFTDSLQCICPDILKVTVTEPDSLLFQSIEVTHTTCGEDNGRIMVSLKGGTRPYTYQWKDTEDNVIGIDSTIIDLRQNTLYRLFVTDKNGCTQYLEQLIQPSKLPRITSVKTTDVLCYGGSTGSAHIETVEAGEPYSPYSFKWSNGTTGDSTENLPAGRHFVTITDENSCTSTYYFDISQPDSLYLLITDYVEPHCFGYSDAYIHTQTIGGAGGNTYLWSTGATTPNLDSIPKGDYWVRVTDANGCLDEKHITLNEPDYQHVDLGEDVLMCPGNTQVIDGGNYVSYRWFTDKGDISNERYLSVTKENRYYLEAKTPDGCSAWGDIMVSIGSDALQADMLIASDAAVGDTLVVFELSNLPLDSLQWDYDTTIFERIITDDETYDLPYVLELRCLQTGIYNIGLTAYSGGCFSPAVKQVEIMEAGDKDDDDAWGAKDPLIQSLKQYPNPTNGVFVVELELREPSDVRLVMFEVSTGICVDQRNVQGSKYYKINYNFINRQTGVYVLIVTAGDERRQVKIIIE